MKVLHQQLDRWLHSLQPRSRSALLLWLSVDADTPVDEVFESLQPEMALLRSLEPGQSYELLKTLQLQEKIHFALVNEFGSTVTQKTWFTPLTEQIATQMTKRVSVHLDPVPKMG